MACDNDRRRAEVAAAEEFAEWVLEVDERDEADLVEELVELAAKLGFNTNGLFGVLNGDPDWAEEEIAEWRAERRRRLH